MALQRLRRSDGNVAPRVSHMNRSSILFIGVSAILGLGACTRPRNEPSVESTPDVSQAMTKLRGAYAAFNRGDVDAAVASLDPQIEWIEPAEFPGGGAFHGRDEVKRYLAQSRASLGGRKQRARALYHLWKSHCSIRSREVSTPGQQPMDRCDSCRRIHAPRRKNCRDAGIRRSARSASLGQRIRKVKSLRI
jgi:ketosteroid isomerase-like protein